MHKHKFEELKLYLSTKKDKKRKLSLTGCIQDYTTVIPVDYDSRNPCLHMTSDQCNCQNSLKVLDNIIHR